MVAKTPFSVPYIEEFNCRPRLDFSWEHQAEAKPYAVKLPKRAAACFTQATRYESMEKQGKAKFKWFMNPEKGPEYK